MIGAKFLGQLELLVVDVDGDDGGTADLGVLDREMAKPSDAEYRDQRPGRAPESLIALYVVTPAQVSTEASSGSTASGT